MGKSTLFNRLSRKRAAIVHPEPGVTRDRNTSIIDYRGFQFILIDTGGFEPETNEPILEHMRRQSQLAVEEADGIIFLLDRIDGWTHQDEGIYDFLRQSGKPIYFTVNKVDDSLHESGSMEFYESGAAEVLFLSSSHGRGMDDLLARMADDFPEIQKEEEKDEDDSRISVAIVGRPNVGKSSITNCFLGSEKQIVHDMPGTTRDPIDNFCRFGEKEFRLIDTAGIKRKARVSQTVDKYSMIGAIKVLERADVGLLVIDATQGVVDQDARIAGYILERGRSIIIVVNKWDLVKKDNKTVKETTQLIYDKLPFLSFAPIVFVSAKTGKRIPAILEKTLEVYDQYNKRIQTSDLNRVLQVITARHTPPSKGSSRTKILYSTQVKTKPPSFIITSNHPKNINLSYQRFITNQFRHYFGFEGTPIRIFWRDKNKNDDQRSKNR